jgi:hypothetical protein
VASACGSILKAIFYVYAHSARLALRHMPGGDRRTLRSAPDIRCLSGIFGFHADWAIRSAGIGYAVRAGDPAVNEPSGNSGRGGRNGPEQIRRHASQARNGMRRVLNRGTGH